MKERAYFEDHDRVIIRRWSQMRRSDTGLILQKLNSERKVCGKPTFKMKALIEELRRGGGDDRTGEGYNPDKAKKAYRIGKNKNLSFFDERSALILRWFLAGCRMTPQEAYQQYRLLRKHGCDIIKLSKVADVEWLMRHGYLDKRINDERIFGCMRYYLIRTDGVVYPQKDRNWVMAEEYLKENPTEGKYVIYGEPPADYRQVDEATGCLIDSTETGEVAEKQGDEKIEEAPKETASEDLTATDENDVTTINIVGNGRIRIINTSPNVEYQITRKGNEWVIMMQPATVAGCHELVI